MGKNSLSCNIAIEGQVFHCPTRIMLGGENGEPVFGGTIQSGNRSISDTIAEVDRDMAGQAGKYIDGLLPKYQPEELSILYRKGMTVIAIQEKNINFRLAMGSGNTAVVFAFQMCEKANKDQAICALLEVLERVVGFFGIKKLLFYAQTGDACLLPALENEKAFANIPEEMRRKKLLVYSHICMEKNNAFSEAVKKLFGMTETELFLGIDNNEFACMITLPSINTSIMRSDNLYIMMELGKETAFILKGDFIFKPLKDMRFTVDCSVGTKEFGIEALAHMEEPVPLPLEPFAIGDTCLMIKMSPEPTFGMYTNLYIRKLQMFAAVMWKMEGKPVPDFLAAALSDLSIPILVEELLGKKVEGIECFDFIKIAGLPFQQMSAFSAEALEKKDIPAIVGQFNTQVQNASLRLDENQVQLTKFSGGMELSDLSRMRHYYISPSGALQLMAQFYYSTVETRFGNYKISRGLFICGTIVIFQKSFEVLFSFNEKDGLLAYAKIPSMDLGFLSIGPSGFSKKGSSMLPVAEDSVLRQFINLEQEGMVFFLSAGEKELSFYMDGSINILRLFSVDARIVFCQGLVSIDLQTVWLSILQITLHLKVEYRDFQSGNFEFCLMIDTSRLTEKLVAVTKKLEHAIQTLQNRIDNATRELDRAQNHVNELYGEIHKLDDKINQCREAIRHASWWKKAFVAIAKGIEIGAYEVAKAGLYAAIGVATAALNVAKAAVNLGGIIGEGVLEAVKAVIKGAMSLFYLNYIRLTAQTDSRKQYFQAEIEFVALGKTYHLNTIMEHKAIQEDSVKVISDNINKTMEPDLEKMENGSFRTSWRKYQHENYTVSQHCERLDKAKIHMESSVQLMQSMQNTYIEEFQTPMEEFDEMNVSLIEAMANVENVLAVGSQAGDVTKLENSMNQLQENINEEEKNGVFRDGELDQAKEMLGQYNEAKNFYHKISGSLADIQEQRKSMENHCKTIKAATAQTGEVVVNGTDGDAGRVLRQVQEQMYTSFPVDRSGRDFINLSREPLIQEYFAHAEERLGTEPSQHIQQMRSRSRAGSYRSRL